MGVKGAKRTTAAVEEQGTVVALLAPLGKITGRGQFGGYGVFADGKMFGLITSDGVLHLKANEDDSDRFGRGARFGRMPYYRVPADVRANTRKLRSWAKKAIAGG